MYIRGILALIGGLLVSWRAGLAIIEVLLGTAKPLVEGWNSLIVMGLVVGLSAMLLGTAGIIVALIQGDPKSA